MNSKRRIDAPVEQLPTPPEDDIIFDAGAFPSPGHEQEEAAPIEENEVRMAAGEGQQARRASQDELASSPPSSNRPHENGEPPPNPPVPCVEVFERVRDPKFAVIVEGRIPRDNTVLTQVSIPMDLHLRLQRDSLGSLNQVLMGLVRYALQELDHKDATLHVRRKGRRR